MAGQRKKNAPEDLIPLLKGRHLHEPPAGVVRRALALREGLEPARKRIARWLAEIVFDSALQPMPAGVRGGAGTERRLLYQLRESEGSRPGAQLDVRFRDQARGGVEVRGQLLPPWPDAEVKASAARASRKTRLSGDGEFVLRGVPGKRKIRIEIRRGRAAAVAIDIPPCVVERDKGRSR